MSNTSESVPPSLGAMFLYLFVLESKTAMLATLPKTVPLRCSTREKRPPTQMLVPTCSIALTRPSTIGVSYVVEGEQLVRHMISSNTGDHCSQASAAPGAGEVCVHLLV